jgi:hypothetical protein
MRSTLAARAGPSFALWCCAIRPSGSGVSADTRSLMTGPDDSHLFAKPLRCSN